MGLHENIRYEVLTQQRPLPGQSVSLWPGDQQVDTAPAHSASESGEAAGHWPASEPPSAPPAHQEHCGYHSQHLVFKQCLYCCSELSCLLPVIGQLDLMRASSANLGQQTAWVAAPVQTSLKL